MTHSNRGRLVVDPAGKWKLYTQTLPAGSAPAGTITRPNGEVGALVRMPTGVYVQINAGAIRALDQRKVLAALAGDGDPAP
jgi:Flp pilus assembly protein CpaB